MSSTHPTSTGPVRPRAGVAQRPGVDPVISGGFWARRRQVNAEIALPQGPEHLETAGNLHNLRLVAGAADGSFQGDYPFQDTDVYKWLEAASWQHDGDLAESVDELISLVAAAQEPDGYLNTWVQSGRGEGRYADLRWGHELYCAGHLIQAAVAHHRATGSNRLLDVARRFADHLDDTFGLPDSGKPIDGIDGHAEVETALVELYRETGERRYLELAAYFVDRHGHGLLGGEAYCQDRVPVREADNVEGHAVRQLYLLAAVADLAAETGDDELKAAAIRLWHAMVATKTHLTGGVGAHHDKEDFGDPFELPNERAYCETCAAIASIQFSWRLALLTGDARYADLIERTLFNGFLAGMSLDGERWLYVNPLQVRDGHTDPGGDHSARRTRWFRCACCPPNVMRLLASLPHYFSATDDTGLYLHQYATGRYCGSTADGPVAVGVDTEYPWQGRIVVTVAETPDTAWTLSLRIPQWCADYAVSVDGAEVTDGWLRITRAWTPGETVVLDLELPVRLVRADPRVDSVRGCVAIERGPLVYCLEQVDNPGGGLDDILFDPTRSLSAKDRPDLLDGVVTVTGAGGRRAVGDIDWWPYSSDPSASDPVPVSQDVELTAVPYYAWANRADGSMRVWLPTR